MFCCLSSEQSTYAEAMRYLQVGSAENACEHRIKHGDRNTLVDNAIEQQPIGAYMASKSSMALGASVHV